jgi:hypothetical protein
MVHFYRNIFGHLPATKVREVRHMLKAIHAQESRDAADRKRSQGDEIDLGVFTHVASRLRRIRSNACLCFALAAITRSFCSAALGLKCQAP